MKDYYVGNAQSIMEMIANITEDEYRVFMCGDGFEITYILKDVDDDVTHAIFTVYPQQKGSIYCQVTIPGERFLIEKGFISEQEERKWLWDGYSMWDLVDALYNWGHGSGVEFHNFLDCQCAFTEEEIRIFDILTSKILRSKAE